MRFSRAFLLAIILVLGYSPLPLFAFQPPAQPTRADSYATSISTAILGQILLEGGQMLPEPVPVQVLCKGENTIRWTDGKGRFSVELGHMFAGSSLTPGAAPKLNNCRLLVEIPGFASLTHDLSRINSLSDLELGKLVLKPTTGTARGLFSARAATLPEAARRAYIRALNASGEKNFDAALKELDKLLTTWPDHAPGWQLRGQILERQARRDQALAAYRRAAEADPDYLKPRVQLAELAAEDQDPAGAVQWAAEVNRLAPGVFPHMAFTEAAGYFNLDRFDEAAKAAAAGCAADKGHSFPRLRKVLGESLYRLNRYRDASAAFAQYLADAPDAPDAGDVRLRQAESSRLALALNR